MITALAGVAAFVGAYGELSHWLASRIHPGKRPASAGSLGLLVLGHPSYNNGDLHPIQHWRCQIAVRAANTHAGPVKVVFTGWQGRRPASEATVMAEHAQQMGLVADSVLLEEEASTTWENVELGAPLLRDCDQIAIVSNSHHALRGRHYLRKLYPQLAARLVRVDDYRFGEFWRDKLRFGWFETAMSSRYGIHGPLKPNSRRSGGPARPDQR